MIKRMMGIFFGMVMCLVALSFGSVLAADENDAEIPWEKYGQTIYNTTNGLMSNRVSSIVQTNDGVAWIGTDEGLVAFDGNEFVEYGGFFHFDGINDAIITDAGMVWFATTTYGGAIYLGNRFQHFDDVGEHVSNYATTIAEDDSGDIYVGNLRSMVRISPTQGYTVKEYQGEGYLYVNSLTSCGNTIMGATINGDVFFLQDGEETCRHEGLFTGSASVGYSDGFFLLGTSDGRILVFDVESPETGVVCETMPGLELTAGCTNAINDFYADGDRLWVLLDGGIGYYILGADGAKGISDARFIQCHFDDFESGYTDMMKDYQGNYWISSSRRGVLLLRLSEFTNELAGVKDKPDTINSVCKVGGSLYLGTDSGIVVIDGEHGMKKMLGGMRVMDVRAAGDGLYAAVYGQGLLKLSADGSHEMVYAMDTIRKIDGEYILGDDGAVDILNNSLYAGADVVYNTRITCVASVGDRLFFGSDGAGIYVYEDGSLKEVIDENSGIPSKTVNDLCVYGDGFFVATGHGIACYNGRKLTVNEKLPKDIMDSPVYSLHIMDDELYAVGSQAVYVFKLEELLDYGKETELKYVTYYAPGKLGAGYYDGGERVYIPSGSDIYSIAKKDFYDDVSDYKLLLQSVKGDLRDAMLTQTGENEYVASVTKDVKKIDIFCSVLNFSSNDPYVRYILHGVDKEFTVVKSSELEHIIFEDLEGGTYTFWFELLDSDMEMAQRIVLTIDKEKGFFERLSVRMAGLAAGFAVLMYFVFKDRKKEETLDGD